MSHPESLSALPRDEGGPVCAAPWRVQVFALTVQLSGAGHFAWTKWMNALGAELQRTAKRSEPDDGSHCYNHALEGLLTANGLTDCASLYLRKNEWAEAHRTTPHGKPIVLETSAVREQR